VPVKEVILSPFIWLIS